MSKHLLDFRNNPFVASLVGLLLAIAYYGFHPAISARLIRAAGEGHSLWYGPMFGFPFALFFPSSLFLAGAVLALLFLRMQPRAIDYALLVLIPLLLVIPSYVLLFHSAKPQSTDFYQSFSKVIQATKNPDQLQQWATKFLETRPTKEATEYVSQKDVPQFVLQMWQGFQPQVLVQPAQAEQDRYIMINYRGNVAAWGIAVGKPHLKLRSNDVFDYSEWKPGVFLYMSKNG